jgi:hypothetical protein
MSYRAATYGLARIGIPDDTAHVTCDGCGARVEALARRGMPKAWVLKGRAPPGWKLVKQRDETRLDYCPACKLQTGVTRGA